MNKILSYYYLHAVVIIYITSTTHAVTLPETKKKIPTSNEVNQISFDINNEVIPACGNARRAGVIGGVVRLAFHDAGTFDVSNPTSTQVDGCIDIENPDNGGLLRVINLLQPIYERHNSSIGRADFWQLAANVAIASSLPTGAILQLPTRFGRKDSKFATKLCNNNFGLPDAEKSHFHTTAVFQNRMGFSQREITALMGAHTLGRADTAESGYDGAWVNRNFDFDNSYYRDIIGRPWVRETSENGLKHMWRDPGTGLLMLNTDMALAFEIGNDENVNTNRCRTGGGGGGGGDGGDNRCGTNVETRQYVQLFARNQPEWFAAFVPAWMKMQELGYDNLEQEIIVDGQNLQNTIQRGGDNCQVLRNNNVLSPLLFNILIAFAILITFTAWVTLMIFVFRWFVCKRSVEKKSNTKNGSKSCCCCCRNNPFKKNGRNAAAIKPKTKGLQKQISSSDKFAPSYQIYVVDEDGKEHLATMPYGSETFSNIFGSETKNTTTEPSPRRNHNTGPDRDSFEMNAAV